MQHYYDRKHLHNPQYYENFKYILKGESHVPAAEESCKDYVARRKGACKAYKALVNYSCAMKSGESQWDQPLGDFKGSKADW